MPIKITGLFTPSAGVGAFKLVDASDIEVTTAQQGGVAMKETIVLTAAGGAPATTSGCSEQTKVEAGTNDIDYWVLDFDQTTQEYAFWDIVTPDNYDGGTITARFYWTAASGSGTVEWAIAGRSYADDDAIDAATGTAQVADDTLITAGDVHITVATPAITLAGGPVGGEMVQIRVTRVVGADNLTADARLLAVKLEFGVTGLSS